MRTTTSLANASSNFLSQLGNKVSAVLHGFDRLRLRGTLRELYQPTVMEAYLCAQHMRYCEYGALVQHLTAKVKASAEALAAKLARPVVYLASSARNKEQEARQIAARDGVQKGLIAIFKAVEPCQAYALRRQREASGFEFRMEVRKCLHFYFYFEHATFGFMHVRLQSWFPFRVEVCLNGRHWLARQLDAAGIAYRKRESALIWVADPVAAQRLLDAQVHWNWRESLEGLLEQTHPQSALIRRPLHLEYGLIKRGGLDEIADGFGLGKIDTAIEVGAQSKFAGFSEAGAGFQRAVDAVAQDYGGAVAGNFDYVFGREGVRSGEVRDDHLIDEVAVVCEEIAEGCVP